MVMEHPSIKVAKYKCFQDEYEGFDVVRPINVLIGRNNSGKSALLDVVEFACTADINSLVSKDQASSPDVIYTVELVEQQLKNQFRESNRQNYFPRTITNDWEYGSNFIGECILAEMKFKQPIGVHESSHELFLNKPVYGFTLSEDMAKAYAAQLTQQAKPGLAGKSFRRLLADRDVRPEADSQAIRVNEDGTGVTNTIRKFLNSRNMPSEKVEAELFNGLKEIFKHDAEFEKLLVQHDDKSSWEIFLSEPRKGHIPLSGSGSGLKTIISILVLVHLIPHEEAINLEDFVLAIEEPENNLHPALLRRLLAYLERLVSGKGLTLFVTTHSPVCIDFFQKSEAAQILHVKNDGEKSTCETVKTHVTRNGVMDDLDVRASDLLQSNGIVWVEGPSDRIHLNRWLELFGANRYREGTDYQCMFYGGRLLSHLSGSDPTDDKDELIKLLSINRNAAVLIDSDKRSRQTPLNDTKKRIEAEFGSFGGFVWVTKGREIENYLPVAAISKELDISGAVPPIGQYEDVRDYLESHKTGEGRRFERAKAVYAERFGAHLLQEDLSQCLDLPEKMAELMQHIDRWNGNSGN